MAATILPFPSADEARKQARDRRIKGLAQLMAALIKGEREPANPDEQRLAELAMKLDVLRCAALREERARNGEHRQ